jgi:hemerythrin-like domain-containing protein
MVELTRNFAEPCHHSTKQRHLFARVDERGMSRRSGPIAAVLMQNEQGRRRIAAIAEALPSTRNNEAVGKDSLYCDPRLLRDHIDKEDNVLAFRGDDLLSQDNQETLVDEFEKIEAEERGNTWRPESKRTFGRMRETIVIRMVRQ